MAIKDEDIGFGESTVVVKPSYSSARRKIRVYCHHCGSEKIEVTFWCTWDIPTQRWVSTGECSEDAEPYCPNCGDTSEVEEERIAVPGET